MTPAVSSHGPRERAWATAVETVADSSTNPASESASSAKGEPMCAISYAADAAAAADGATAEASDAAASATGASRFVATSTAAATIASAGGHGIVTIASATPAAVLPSCQAEV